MKELKEELLERYFPHEKREVKVEEFTNLKQGNIRVEEYYFKFTVLSKYAPYLVSNSKDKMSRFVNGVAYLVKDECLTTMSIMT